MSRPEAPCHCSIWRIHHGWGGLGVWWAAWENAALDESKAEGLHFRPRRGSIVCSSLQQRRRPPRQKLRQQPRRLLLLAQGPPQTWTCYRLLFHGQARSAAMMPHLISGVMS